MNPKPLCIYHGQCFDGFTAAWAVWKRFGENCDFHEGLYGSPPPDVSGRDVIIVDFSYKRDVLMGMLQSGDVKQAMSVLILDHHKTAAADLEGLLRPGDGWGGGGSGYNPASWRQGWETAAEWPVRAIFDMDRSGAGLAWDFFHPGEARPRFLAHVEDRDLWRFAMEGTREVHAAMSAHPFTFEAWDAIYATPIPALIREGAAIDRKHKRDVETLVPIMRYRMSIGGHSVWAASIPMTMTSDAGQMMAQGEPFAACYWDTAEGRVFSLRSVDGGADVSEIAKRYGGGGHRNAAGFRLPHGVAP